MPNAYKVAAVQAEPIWFDLDATVTKTIDLIGQAANAGAQLVAFPETWIPGYPHFLWLGPVANQMPYVAQYHANSLSTKGPEIAAIRDAARKHSITVAIGYSEKAGGTLYMSQSVFGPDGQVLIHRRKLKPSHVERSLFGEGDGSDLQVVDTPLGRLGALNCWEHLQPLTKYAMYAQNEQVHISGWPCFGLYKGIAHGLGEAANMAASLVYALEGSCFVIASTQTVSIAGGIDVFCSTEEQRTMLQPGGGASRVYSPDGQIISNLLAEDEEGLVFAEVDLDQIVFAKNAADPAGHYSRPDVTRLLFDNRPHPAVVTRLTLPVEATFPDLDDSTLDLTILA